MTRSNPAGGGVLDEHEEIIRAIREGEVDAFVVTGPQGERIYSLRSADVLYRRMVEDMQEGAVALDSTGLVVYCNRFFVDLMRCEREAIVGKSILEFVPAASRSFFDALGNACGQTSRQEISLQAGDGAMIPVLATMNRILVEEEHEVCCLIVSDLTDKKRGEEMLVHSRRKDEFLAMLAHELRNPLAPIRNAVDLLGLKVPLDPQLAWVRGVIDRQVTQMTRLVDDLLDVSRIATGKIRLEIEPVDLAVAAGGAVEAVRPLIAARKQELAFTPPAHPLRVRADAARMSQIVSNLLNNAAKFTPERGRIGLSLEECDGWAHIRVTDNGAGIAPDMLPRIFDLFTQGDSHEVRSHGGLGIGLTLVRNLVEMQGGTVRVSSAGPGQGSEFLVRVPLLSSARAGAPGAKEGARAGLTILIVDDNADAAESLELLLGRDGHEVRTCQDGQSAIRIARSFEPQVVLLDIGLPGMSGYETARELRRIPGGRRATIVALTGFAADEVRRESAGAGIDRFWIKPVRVEALRELLASIAAQEEPPRA